jgi:hypothetical protein
LRDAENVTEVESLKTADRLLQAAQLAADADALDQLPDDRLVFTGPDGSMYSKQDDLELQRSGGQRLTEMTEEQLTAVVVGDTGVTWLRGRLAGQFKGEEFVEQVRHTCIWIKNARRLAVARSACQPSGVVSSGPSNNDQPRRRNKPTTENRDSASVLGAGLRFVPRAVTRARR